MPCRDDWDTPEAKQYLANEACRKRLDERTADLCEVMAFLEKDHPKVYEKIDQEIRNWHHNHKLDDQIRKLKEQLR